MIINGAYKKTKLRCMFEENLLRRTGIHACHSDFCVGPYISSPYIFVSADIIKTPSIFNTSDWEVTAGIYYPKGKMRNYIFECFNDAAEKCGLSCIEFPIKESVSAVSFDDYESISGNIYFSINIVQIDIAARKEFPNIDFVIRFCRSSGKTHYYLIFSNKDEQIGNMGITGKITDFVDALCKHNDPLHIFENEKLMPIVTDKVTLKESGKVMGIVKNCHQIRLFIVLIIQGIMWISIMNGQ